MRTAKDQISLRMRAVWSRPSLSAKRIIWYHRMYESGEKCQNQTAYVQDDVNLRMLRMIEGTFCHLTRPIYCAMCWKGNLCRMPSASAQIALRNRAVRSGSSLYINNAYNIQRFCKRIVKILIILRRCTCWSWPLLSAYAKNWHFVCCGSRINVEKMSR